MATRVRDAVLFLTKGLVDHMSWQVVLGSEERLDASDPQKPPPMNYSATSTKTFYFLTLLVSGPGQPLSLKGDEGESDRC